MAQKRSHATYEDDAAASRPPFVFYGTPLPALDSEARDDGSYVPVWKQEVTDERGRKRLHGAFTGGFSAGYFNTVGSKEGWTPSTFVSSRSSRQNARSQKTQQKAEDYMDEEDLADAAEAKELQTSASFAGLGGTADDVNRQRDLLMDILKSKDLSIGQKLLKRMGWREGQGLGPRIRRRARAHETGSDGDQADGDVHAFAPDDPEMVQLARKTDSHGLGFDDKSTLLESMGSGNGPDHHRGQLLDDVEDEHIFPDPLARPKQKPKPKSSGRGGFGVGILNDTGSDEEDPYEIGPRVAYNKSIVQEKKQKKKKGAERGPTPVAVANPLLANKPIFVSKKSGALKSLTGFRKCHDGRLPLEGFVLSNDSEPLPISASQEGRYPPPVIPEDWKTAKQPTLSNEQSSYQSTAESAKASTLDARSRALILGEAQLPGKSVFDFLSPAARDRLSTASGKTNLPPGRDEAVLNSHPVPAQTAHQISWSLAPRLDKNIALKALGRGIGGWMPYAEDEAKRGRYRTFLEVRAMLRENPPDPPTSMSKEDWLKELHEFAHAAEIFKPMTGIMASRFTTSSSLPQRASDASDSNSDPNTVSLVGQTSKKSEDPTEAAAKAGMYGPMTRSIEQFFPTRLLCKRFNVKPPAHVHSNDERKPRRAGGHNVEGLRPDSTNNDAAVPLGGPSKKAMELLSMSAMQEMLHESGSAGRDPHDGEGNSGNLQGESLTPNIIDVECNEALEASRPGEAVFRAIFGSDDEDD